MSLIQKSASSPTSQNQVHKRIRGGFVCRACGCNCTMSVRGGHLPISAPAESSTRALRWDRQGPDLVITKMTCTVDGTKGPYNFHNVYIFGDGTMNGTGTLVFSNASMKFYAANILVQNGGILQATGIGANNGGQVIEIHLYGDGSEPGITCKKIDNGNLVDDPMCGVPDGSNGSSPVWGFEQDGHAVPDEPCTKTSQLNPPTKLPGGVDDCFYQYGMFDGNDLPNAYFGRKVLAVVVRRHHQPLRLQGRARRRRQRSLGHGQQLDAAERYAERRREREIAAGQRHARRLAAERLHCRDRDRLSAGTRGTVADVQCLRLDRQPDEAGRESRTGGRSIRWAMFPAIPRRVRPRAIIGPDLLTPGQKPQDP